MREIVFRRCRLEIEPNHTVRIIIDKRVAVTMPPPMAHDHMAELEAATFDYDDANKLHVDRIVAAAFIMDCNDESFAADEDVRALLTGTPPPSLGKWGMTANVWFDKVRRGWAGWPHGQPVVVTNVTSFIGSAVTEDRRASGRNNVGEPTVNVGVG